MTMESRGGPTGKRRYPNKASWYQDEADTKRMRAAFHATKDILGYASLSDFINAAVNEKVAGLEARHNGGQPWQPLDAGQIPQGKPARRPSPAPVTATPVPAQKYLADLVKRVHRELTAQPGVDGQVTVFDSSSGLEAVIEAYDTRSGISVLRHYEALHAGDSISVRTATGVAWDRQEEGSALFGWMRRSRPDPDLAEELAGIVEKSRARLAAQYRNPLSGEVKVFTSRSGPEVLIDSYDTGDEASTLRCYGLNTSTSGLYLREAGNVSWEEADAIPYSDIQPEGA
jgi:hypothetical protein